MVPILFILSAAVALGAAAFALTVFCRTWMKTRGSRLITCPETNAPAGVKVDAFHAAVFGFTRPKLRLQECTRWPERRNCGQECLNQIAAAPQDCLVRNILARWYANKNCVVCGKPVGDIDWLERKPALYSSNGQTLEWSDLDPEAIPQVLATHLPICWNCHIAATFRRQCPELVTDRAPTKSRIALIH